MLHYINIIYDINNILSRVFVLFIANERNNYRHEQQTDATDGKHVSCIIHCRGYYFTSHSCMFSSSPQKS